MAADNKLLGNFNLEGIAPAPRGMPQIEVTFDIDANGIVSVGAKDKGTGKEQKITIKADGGLSDEDIEKMVKEAEANKESDKKKRELVEAKNQSETITHQITKQLKEHGDKISEEEKKAIEDANAELVEATKTDDVDKINESIKKLTEASMKLGEAVYKQAQEEQAQPEQQGESTEENVVDADFKEVDPKEEDKK
jgi:molecular chaperone DnaK